MALELAKPALTGSTMEQTYFAKFEVKFALVVVFAADLVSTALSLIVYQVLLLMVQRVVEYLRSTFS